MIRWAKRYERRLGAEVVKRILGRRHVDHEETWKRGYLRTAKDEARIVQANVRSYGIVDNGSQF